MTSSGLSLDVAWSSSYQPSMLDTTGVSTFPPGIGGYMAHPRPLELDDEAYAFGIQRNKGPKREYQCDVCLKMFSCSSNLKRHMSVHTGYKPYTCQYCHMAFSNSSNRRKHERSHVRRMQGGENGDDAGEEEGLEGEDSPGK